MLGLFLCAAQEYPSVQFRTLAIGPDTDLRAALGLALDRGYPVVEMMHRDGRVFTSEGRVAPSVFNGPASLHLSPGDVIVMSGGARGHHRPPGPQPGALQAPPGLSGEDTAQSRH